MSFLNNRQKFSGPALRPSQLLPLDVVEHGAMLGISAEQAGMACASGIILFNAAFAPLDVKTWPSMGR